MSEAYTFPPAAASPPEVLELKPNNDVPEGPHPQVSPTTYVTWTRSDGGGSFVAPLSNSETYERKGYTKGAEVEIPDFVAYVAEQAGKSAEAAKPAEHASKAKAHAEPA